MGHVSRQLLRQSRFVPLLAIAALTTGCVQAAKSAGTPPATSSSASSTEDVQQISLERTPCFGACSTFTLQVDANGQASLSLPSKRAAKMAADGQSEPITLTGQVTAAQLQQLIVTLHDGEFAALDPDYSANISDMPGTVITMTSASGKTSTRVYGVPCASQAKANGMDQAMGPAKLVPDVFCQAAKQLDAMACAVYANGKPALPVGVEARFPPRCEAAA